MKSDNSLIYVGLLCFLLPVVLVLLFPTEIDQIDDFYKNIVVLVVVFGVIMLMFGICISTIKDLLPLDELKQIKVGNWILTFERTQKKGLVVKGKRI